MAEPESIADASYQKPSKPLNTGGPSSADASVMSGLGLEHKHVEAFTYADMVNWIKRRLGGDLWRLEGMNPEAINDCIGEALMLYSNRVPRLWYEMVGAGVKTYTPKAAAVLGCVRCDFIYPISASGGYQAEYNWISNLTVAGIIPSAGPGLLMPAGDLMMWLMARKSFQRVASLTPQYVWDPSAKLLHIYNYSVNYYTFALFTLSKTFAEVNVNHKHWLRSHALAMCRLLLAENREKFDGQIQAPGGGMISTNAERLMTRAREDVDKSTDALMAFQTRAIPIWGD